MNFELLTDAALERLWASGFNALSPREQLLVAIWGLETGVNNGGFHQYYSNSHGDQARVVPHLLNEIGAARMAELVAAANLAFGVAGPPQDRAERQLRLTEIEDGAAFEWERLEHEFWQYPEDIGALLQSYLACDGRAA